MAFIKTFKQLKENSWHAVHETLELTKSNKLDSKCRDYSLQFSVNPIGLINI